MNRLRVFSLTLCVGFLVTALLLLGASARAVSSVLYVAPDGSCGGPTPCYDSVQDAVSVATEGATIKVAMGVYTSFSTQVLSIKKGVTIIGGYSTTDWLTSLPETRLTVLDAQDFVGRRVIQVNNEGVVPIRLEGLVVKRGHTPLAADGGGIYITAGIVTVHKCRIVDNVATGSYGGGGGGVFLRNGTLTISESAIENNRSFSRGGGLAASNGTVLITDSVIQDNTSTDNGGGVLVSGASATLRRNTIRENSPMGVFVAGGTAFLDYNIIESNTSTGNGGGIGVSGAYPTSATASHNLIQKNTAASGGGVGVTAGYATLYANDIVSNTATSNGGGIAAWANGSLITVVGNRIRWNTSGSQGGGGLYINDGNLTLERNDIQQNLAPGTFGGGMVVAGGRVVGISDVIARNNSMAEGVYVSGGTLVARHWTLVSNGSFALMNNGGFAYLTNTIVASHTLAGLWGQDIVADYTLFYKNGTRCGNYATCDNFVTGSPAFVDPAAGDYHITVTSLAANSGIDAGVARDMDNEPRLGIPDLGADECWPPGWLKHIYVPLILRNSP